jgi:hypothetical protein
MDLISLIQAIQDVPYIGPLAVYLPPLVMLGAVVSTVLPAPAADAGGWYRALYAVVQWCALNKLRAANAEQPVPKPAGAPKLGDRPTPLTGVLALAVGLVLLGACTAPTTARQGIYAAGSGYAAALKVAIAYASLPRCGQPASPPVCSDQRIVSQVSDAAQLARPVIDAALDTAASTSASDSALSQASTAAGNALAAFRAVVAQIEGK